MRGGTAALALVACCAVAAYIVLSPQKVAAPADIPLMERKAPATALRIVALGTSLTQNGTWPEAIARGLNSCVGTPVEIFAIAKAGANSDWGLAQTERVNALLPDLVLVEFAVNDSDLFDGIGLNRSRENMRGIVAAIRTRRPDVQVVFMSTNPARGLRGWQRPLMQQYFDALRSVAAAERVGYFDGWSRWQNDLGSSDLPDGLHPTSGAEARVIVPALSAFIARSFDRDCA